MAQGWVLSVSMISFCNLMFSKMRSSSFCWPEYMSSRSDVSLKTASNSRVRKSSWDRTENAPGSKPVDLERLYNLRPLTERRRVHHLALMYRLAHSGYSIDNARPAINLRSKNKVKFLTPATKLTKILNSPFYRGARLWDMLSEDVQRATTKFKFKKLIQ